MSIVSEEILKEKLKDKPDKLYIQTLQKIQDGEMSLDLFINTGRITPRELFVHYNPKARLRPDCRDVVRYVGGFYIQILSTGEFLLEINDAEQSDEMNSIIKDKSLDVVEEDLWYRVARKFISK
tara:strand:+ start:402 stop:773 length:372 start_codon:yes stop_codon:yes gene_type:complete